MPKLILASHNTHKLFELKRIIEDSLGKKLANDDLISAKDLGLIEPKEDGKTFEDNAIIKAKAVFEQTATPTLADDSGLIVDLFQNAPGILSARWSGKHGDDLKNNQLLLGQLSELDSNLRTAHFVSCVTLYQKDSVISKTGKMQGKIIKEMRGSNGFGYDSIFVPDAYLDTEFAGLTTAQLLPEQKNKISHRTNALKQIVPFLIELFL